MNNSSHDVDDVAFHFIGNMLDVDGIAEHFLDGLALLPTDHFQVTHSLLVALAIGLANLTRKLVDRLELTES